MLTILETHTKHVRPGSVVISVAVESDPGKFIAFQGTAAHASEQTVMSVAESAKAMPKTMAEFIFPVLAQSHKYAVPKGAHP